METEYINLLRHVTQNPCGLKADEELTRRLLHKCQRKYGRTRVIGRQDSLIDMLEDLTMMGPEEDTAKEVLHKKEYQCLNQDCLMTHGTAKLRREIVIRIQNSDNNTVRLADCILEGERIHRAPRGKRCTRCTGTELTLKESYYAMADKLLIRLEREWTNGTRTQTSVIPELENPGLQSSQTNLALSAIIKHKEKENGEYHSTTLAKRADNTSGTTLTTPRSRE